MKLSKIDARGKGVFNSQDASENGNFYQLINNGKILNRTASNVQMMHRVIGEEFKKSENLESTLSELQLNMLKLSAPKTRIFETIFKERMPLSGLMLAHHLSKLGYN
jgi:hypothetical protein